MNNGTIPQTSPFKSSVSMISKYLRFSRRQIVSFRLCCLLFFLGFLLLTFRLIIHTSDDQVVIEVRPVLSVSGTEVIYVQNAVLDCTKTVGAIGGENLEDVINQNEEYELLKMMEGFITISSIPKIDLEEIKSVNQNVIRVAQLLISGHKQPVEQLPASYFYQDRIVFMVHRVEYVNLYHTMTDWFNAFMVMKYLNLEPRQVHILLTDGHPKGSLDSVWHQLFNDSVSRIGAYKTLAIQRPDLVKVLPSTPNGLIFVGKLVIVPYGYASPLSRHSDPQLPHIDDFRKFFLRSYDIDPSAKLGCKVNILIIWRHDYVAHPRNPTGRVTRKIENEQELVNALNSAQISANITALQIDQLSMKDQIKLIATTDILIGMHGAGLTHAIFLPPGSSLIEIVPGYCCSNLEHFESISRWRQLDYLRFAIPPSDDVSSHSSRVNVNRFVNIVRNKWMRQQGRRPQQCRTTK